MPGPESPESGELSSSNSRRRFLAGAGAAAVAGLAGACVATEDSAGVPASSAATAVPVADTPSPTLTQTSQQAPQVVPFRGVHQAGVLLEAGPAGLTASFDVVVGTRDRLVETMQALSAEIERIMDDRRSEPGDEILPPIDSGAIGAESSTAGVAISVAVGASLFDDRFGLADRRPTELIAMPQFSNDRLVSQDLSHGDLLLTVNAPDRQVAAYALHQVVRVTERRLQLRWVQEGFNQPLPQEPGQVAPTRNLMGFRDGTSNLDIDDDQEMRDHVWVQAGDDEPPWAVDGTYQAVRVIRMLIEFWATAALVRQEQIFGRHRDTGAPLGQSNEGDEPAFAADPTDDAVPARAHIRLANPRTADASRILRRGYSYLNGVDQGGVLDQGLLFTCYQRSLSRGFLDVQRRLDGEPLEDYIKPVGGGLFFALPGPAADDDWLGKSLLTA